MTKCIPSDALVLQNWVVLTPYFDWARLITLGVVTRSLDQMVRTVNGAFFFRFQ